MNLVYSDNPHFQDNISMLFQYRPNLRQVVWYLYRELPDYEKLPENQVSAAERLNNVSLPAHNSNFVVVKSLTWPAKWDRLDFA